MDVVDLTVERERRDAPDRNCVRQDREGRELFLFALDYKLNGKTFSIEIWATSFDQAEAHVEAIRSSVTLAGRIKALFPA